MRFTKFPTQGDTQQPEEPKTNPLSRQLDMTRVQLTKKQLRSSLPCNWHRISSWARTTSSIYLRPWLFPPGIPVSWETYSNSQPQITPPLDTQGIQSSCEHASPSKRSLINPLHQQGSSHRLLQCSNSATKNSHPNQRTYIVLAYATSALTRPISPGVESHFTTLFMKKKQTRQELLPLLAVYEQKMRKKRYPDGADTSLDCRRCCPVQTTWQYPVLTSSNLVVSDSECW